jgi:hypothetical protein
MSARTHRQSRAASAPKRSRTVARPVPAATRASLPRVQLPDGSRSVQSPWVWRGFLFMSLIALGLCLTLALDGRPIYAAAWAIVTAGWFGIAMWLWRRHLTGDAAAPLPARRGQPR